MKLLPLKLDALTISHTVELSTYSSYNNNAFNTAEHRKWSPDI
jgi:hypothetical protein